MPSKRAERLQARADAASSPERRARLENLAAKAQEEETTAANRQALSLEEKKTRRVAQLTKRIARLQAQLDALNAE